MDNGKLREEIIGAISLTHRGTSSASLQEVADAILKLIEDSRAPVSGALGEVGEGSSGADIAASPVACDGTAGASQCQSEWRRDHNLLYTLADTGRYRRGLPVQTNRLEVSVRWDPRFATDEEGEALVARLMDCLTATRERDSSTGNAEPAAGASNTPGMNPESEGWVLVPREPTEAMIRAAEDLARYPLGSSTPIEQPDLEASYRAMIAAAPPPSADIRGEGP